MDPLHRRRMRRFFSSLLIASWQISTPAVAQTAIDWESLFALRTAAAAQSGVTASQETTETGAPNVSKSSEPADATGVGADRAVIHPRVHLHGAAVLPSAGWNAIVPVTPIYCFRSDLPIFNFALLPEHTGVRAPPCHAVALAKADRSVSLLA